MPDDITPRRRFKRSTVTKQVIVQTAAHLFAEKGYEATSLDQVAMVAGMAKGTIYYHFSSKEDLYWAVLWPLAEETVDHVEEVAARPEPAKDLLIELVRRAILRARNPRERYMYFEEMVSLNSKMRKGLREQGRRYEQLVAGLIARGQDEGDIVPGNPHIIGLVIIGAIARTARWYDPGGPVGPDEFTETLLRLLLNGMLRAPHPDESDSGKASTVGAAPAGGRSAAP